MKTIDGKRLLEHANLLILTTEVNTSRLARWRLALLIALILCSAAIPARTYRWIDESGVVIYSQTPPPPGIQAEVVDGPRRPAEPPGVARDRLKERVQRFEDDRASRQEAKGEAAKQQANAQLAAKNCAAAKHNLDIYEDAPPNRLYNDDKGVYRRFSAEERAAKVKAAHEAIEKYCK